jgi:hypothetical protein
MRIIQIVLDPRRTTPLHRSLKLKPKPKRLGVVVRLLVCRYAFLIIVIVVIRTERHSTRFAVETNTWLVINWRIGAS